MADRRVRWGVLGAGGIASRRTIPEGIVPAEDARLAIVMDVVTSRAREVGQTYSVPFTTEVGEVLSSGVDVVYVATPNDLHAAQAIAAAEAGKHVFIEKPLSLSLDDADRIIAACAGAGVKLMEGYMMKFHRHHLRARDMIRKGKLGRIVYGRWQLSCWYPPMEGAWRQDPARGGGGALMDMATHGFSLVEWLCADPIEGVFARTTPKVHDYASDDSSCTLLQMASGATFTVDCYYNVPDASVRNRLELYGTEGSLLAEGTIGQDPGGTMRYFPAEQGDYAARQERDLGGGIPVEVKPRSPYLGEVSYFSRSILDDAEIDMNTGEEGKHVLGVALAAYRSAESGTLEHV